MEKKGVVQIGVSFVDDFFCIRSPSAIGFISDHHVVVDCISRNFLPSNVWPREFVVLLQLLVGSSLWIRGWEIQHIR